MTFLIFDQESLSIYKNRTNDCKERNLRLIHSQRECEFTDSRGNSVPHAEVARQVPPEERSGDLHDRRTVAHLLVELCSLLGRPERKSKKELFKLDAFYNKMG